MLKSGKAMVSSLGLCSEAILPEATKQQSTKHEFTAYSRVDVCTMGMHQGQVCLARLSKGAYPVVICCLPGN